MPVFRGCQSNTATITCTGTASAGSYTTSGTSLTGGNPFNDVTIRPVWRQIFLQGIDDVAGLKIEACDDENNEAKIELPDGSRLIFDKLGNYRHFKADGKVKYQANWSRAFNRYVNCSDLLEEFIGDLGMVGCPQDKVLKINLEVFINWLIIRAAEQDKDEEAAKDVPRLEDQKDLTHPRCKCCGRYIPRRFDLLGIHFCNDEHLNKFMTKEGLTHG